MNIQIHSFKIAEQFEKNRIHSLILQPETPILNGLYFKLVFGWSWRPTRPGRGIQKWIIVQKFYQ